ncbi:MAG: protein kinase domain-containing protein [Lachnospiraceae bacterium]
MTDNNVIWEQLGENNEYLQAAAGSIVGTREYQQDYAGAMIQPDKMLAVICDGMGGLDGGERASGDAVRMILEDYRNRCEDETTPDFLCREAVRMDQMISELTNSDGSRLNAGSTVVAVEIVKNELYWMSVGDSKIYILREGILEPLVRPHNYRRSLEDMLRQEEISEEAYLAEVDTKKAEALTSYLGIGGICKMERNFNPFLLQDGDQILLCSDGLYNNLDEDQIISILTDCQTEVGALVEHLITTAQERAKRRQDNTTALLIRYRRIKKGGGSMSRCFYCMKEFADGFDICPHCGYDQTSAAENLYYLSPGTELSGGRYWIGTAINAGGFGIVYKAWDKTFDKMIAIKEYYPGGIATRTPGISKVLVYSEKRKKEYEKGKNRFLNEARKVARFNTHVNIVDVYDFFEDNHTAYMVMEYMDGMTCKEYIRHQGGKLTPDLAVNITLALLDALQVIHKEKIIHRDINPSNIFICQNGIVKLFDFGAARMETSEMSTILTPHYAPPEQYSINGTQGTYTDIYAVGATLYYMLTGVKPEESTDRVTKDQLLPPAKIVPEIPEHISNAVMRAMAIKEELRYQDTAQFRDALMNKGNVRNVEQEIGRRKIRRILQVAAAFGFMVVVGIVCLWTVQRNKALTQLPSVSIEMWVAADHGESPEETELMYENMLTTFYQHHDNVTVEIKAFEEAQYADTLAEAVKNGTLPEVFDSTRLDPTAAFLEPLEETYNRISSPEQFYFLEEYSSLFPNKSQMPLCIQFPVIYASALGQDVVAKPEMADIEAGWYFIREEDFVLYEALLGAGCIETYKELAQENQWNQSEEGYQLLKENEITYYLSDTSDYRQMSQEMPGYYDVVFPNRNSYPIQFDYLFSVNESAGKDEKKAAQWLIYYLLSDEAQDVLAIQNMKGIPLNKRMCADYASVNAQDFADIAVLMEQVTIAGSQVAGSQ